ncbi:MAG: hypothetical protein KJO95_09305 [Gammaproteobacteria bacterium]|nr:hypothetical protein [Gammaproteobacteria bacterium]MBU2677706.1 hypothetical protein [Gammaproteobacteria bacterium]NNL51439.1 hypothetical protein [Woeseiaceae bacterium]
MIKTSILESLHLTNFWEDREDPYPLNYLVTDDQDLVFLKRGPVKELGKPAKLLIEIGREEKRQIDVSYLAGLNTGLHRNTLFPYKDGFGLINHDKPELHLWADLVSEPSVIEVENASNDIDVYDNYLRFASYDSEENRFVIGIGEKHSPHEYAKWWAILDVEGDKGVWTEVRRLERQNYPDTCFHYRSDTLEWLNIINLAAHGGRKFVVTPGGQRTVGRTGKEFEFHILSVFDRDNRLEKNIELEHGRGRFSTSKQYFLLRPKTKKRIQIYDLNKQTLEYDIPLKPKTNLGDISPNHLMDADLRGDRLYVGTSSVLNICSFEH